MYATLPITSCEAERNFSKLSIIVGKQISINHVRGKTELSFYPLYKK